MKEINLTPKATADLEAIWLYSEIKFGVVKADEYIGRFSDIFDVLAAHEIGTRRLELGDHIFSLPVEKHVIFFIPSDKAITILRILNQSQDVLRHLAWQ